MVTAQSDPWGSKEIWVKIIMGQASFWLLFMVIFHCKVIFHFKLIFSSILMLSSLVKLYHVNTICCITVYLFGYFPRGFFIYFNFFSFKNLGGSLLACVPKIIISQYHILITLLKNVPYIFYMLLLNV